MKIILGEGFISGDSIICKVWHSNHWKTTRQFGVRSKLYISIVWDYSVLLFWFHCCSFKKINMFNFKKKHVFDIYLRLLPIFSIKKGGWGVGRRVSKISLPNREGAYCSSYGSLQGGMKDQIFAKKQCYVTLEWSLLKKCFLFKRFLKFKIIDYLPNYQNFCGKSLKFLTQLSLLDILACMFIESWQGRCKQAITLFNCKE